VRDVDRLNLVSAREAALRILAARSAILGRPIESNYPLADFQREGVAQAAAILQRRGGVLIADSVGLGKTFIAAALIEQYIGVGGVVLVPPSALRAMWRRALRPLTDQAPSAIRLVTHGQLSRGFVRDWTPSLVVVDEAHAFRNRNTRRYRGLRQLIGRAHVVLLTATPVNNSLADLYFQLRLFSPDDAFRDVGIASLRALLRGGEEPDRGAVSRLQQAVMIRRTRGEVRQSLQSLSLPGREEVRFPADVRLLNIAHPPLIEAAAVEAVLDATRFAAYRSESTRLLISLSLLKRLQSGRHAAIRSLDRLVDFHRRFLGALGEGRLLDARATGASTDQLWFSELILPELPAGISAKLLRDQVAKDLEQLESLRRQLSARTDPKLPALAHLLSARPPPARTLIFSEFADTAESLWSELRAIHQVGLITGSEARLGMDRCARGEVIRRFAPAANASPEPVPVERVDVLIATDVLAEGLNLQDADAVVSFDLPWNPVRLIQRAGRIDRIGSPHETVVVYNFMPDRDLDVLLGLVRRLRRKLRDVRCGVGQEGAVLEAAEVDAAFWHRLALADGNALDSSPRKELMVPTEDLGSLGAKSSDSGCVSSISAQPSRVLTCWKSQTTLRELIWDGLGTMDDKAAADRLLRKALGSTQIISAPLLPHGVAACQAYLLREARLPAIDPAVSALARAIQRSVMVYGLTVPPELLAKAEAALAVVSGCGDPIQAASRIRSAGGAADLVGILSRLEQDCRRNPFPQYPDWRLIAAIGAD
jgi:hypothetical protein